MADVPSILEIAMEPTSQKILVDTTKIKSDSTITGLRVADIQNWVGSPTSGQNNSTSANAHAKLNWLTDYVNRTYNKNSGGMKSVQRGRVEAYIGYPNSAPISISFVYPSKAFLIAHGHVQARSNGDVLYTYDAADIAVLAGSGTRIEFPALDNLRDISMTCNWQVIEFN